MTTPAIHKGYADVAFGQVHYAESGAGLPVLMLHQTPRSWREFALVLPLVGKTMRAIAVDMPGFGESSPAGEVMTIEGFADGVVGLVDALGLDRLGIVGHHTGGLVAIEAAARLGSRVQHLVLSASPYMTPEKRAMAAQRPLVDFVEPTTDGSHLAELWNRRRGFYAEGEERFLNNFIADAVRVLEVVEDGHHACRRYVMEPRLDAVTCSATVICGVEDRYAMPSLSPMAEHFSTTVRLLPGHVPLPEQSPVEFAEVVTTSFAPFVS